jgi:hypothetical protein
MTEGLHQFYGGSDLHFLTFSCCRRRPLFRNEVYRDLFLKILERVRRRYRLVVLGYVVMPEHVHFRTRSFIGERTAAGDVVDRGTGVEAWVGSQFEVFWGRRRGGGSQVSQKRRDLGHPNLGHPNLGPRPGQPNSRDTDSPSTILAGAVL